MVKQQSTWARVSRSHPCPICENVSWCTRSADGKLCKCMRVESNRPITGTDGAVGWIHATDLPPTPAKQPIRKVADVPGLAMRMFNDPLAAGKRENLAQSLGVSPAAMLALHVGVGFDHDGREFASFPSRDASGTIIGITRRYFDGEKKTYPGTSNAGIFAPEHWWEMAGPIVIVEGASDVAAVYSSGFATLGRPSNVGGAQVISAYLKRRAKGRPALVVGENDCKPERRGQRPGCMRDCRGCAWCWPGRYGARVVANQLRAEFRMPPPEWKDLRAWANGDQGFRESFARWAEMP